MQQKSRIVALASSIQQNIAKVDEYISAHGLPSPSLDASTPLRLDLPEPIAACSSAALEAIDELQTLMLGPLGSLVRHLDSMNSLIGLHAVSHFNMPSAIPIGGEATYTDIADTCHLDPDSTNRILRHAATNYTFTETRPGVFSHTAISRAMAETPLIRQWLGQALEDMWTSASHVVPSMIKWSASEEPYETGFNLANRTNEPYFVNIARSPQHVRKFADAMNFMQVIPGLQATDIVTSYDWASLGHDALLVDVGGSNGKLAMDIVNAFPSIRAVVQDLPETIEGAILAGRHKVSDRVTFQAQDFLAEQKVKNADAYLFRMIFHDWSDKYCARILRNLIPALKPGAKVLINDFCLPEPNTTPRHVERNARCHDLVVKALFNAKERDLNDWTNLFNQADPRFKFMGLNRLPSSRHAFLEVVWEG